MTNRPATEQDVALAAWGLMFLGLLTGALLSAQADPVPPAPVAIPPAFTEYIGRQLIAGLD